MEDVASAVDFTLEGFAKEYRTLYFELSLEASTGGPIRSMETNEVILSSFTMPVRE